MDCSTSESYMESIVFVKTAVRSSFFSAISCASGGEAPPSRALTVIAICRSNSRMWWDSQWIR